MLVYDVGDTGAFPDGKPDQKSQPTNLSVFQPFCDATKPPLRLPNYSPRKSVDGCIPAGGGANPGHRTGVLKRDPGAR